MNTDKYKNDYPYPETLSKPRLKTLGPHPTATEMQDYCEVQKKYISDLAVYDAAMVHHRSEKEKYSKRENELSVQFQQDAFEELGISNNPKRHKLFSKAWEMGHSCGYSEVWNYMLDLVDLIS